MEKVLSDIDERDFYYRGGVKVSVSVPTKDRDPETIPRCDECRHWTRIKNDLQWGICNAWGLRDKRYENISCYKWSKLENK